MPRFKTDPLRRRSSHTESRDLNDSVMDPEEVRRLEEELKELRREKSKQIRKMMFRLENEAKRFNDSPYDSSEIDATIQYTDEEEPSTVKARQSTRDLADGFEKAQQRFMFNVENIEEKYKERERSGIPESQVEVDFYGNFFFPETMSGSRQQNFVNRMYQQDALFGKGSVSAPRNSLHSFEGDSRALEKSLKLDQKFRKELKSNSEYPFNQRREERIYSSSHVSGIPFRANIPSTSNGQFASRYSDDLDYDNGDVFEAENRRPRREFKPDYGRYHPAMRPPIPKNNVMDESEDDEEEEEETEDDEDEDEETTEGEESFSDETDEDADAESEATPVALKLQSVSAETVPEKAKMPASPHQNTPESVRKEETKLPPIFNSTPKTPRVIKKESTPTSVKKDTSSRMMRTPKDVTAPSELQEAKNPSNPSNPAPTETVVVKKEAPVTPKALLNVTTAAMNSLTDEENKRKSSEFEEPIMALPGRPSRAKKPTEKMMAAMSEAKHDHVHSHEHSIEADSQVNGKKRSSGKNIFCKHCEYVKEEKRKAREQKKNSFVLAQEPPADTSTPSTSNAQDVKMKEVVETKQKRRSKKELQLLQVKRRSGTEASEEPEKKKQKLIDSDLLSIPSSMAIVVDTELIAAENPSLMSSAIPPFSDNSHSSSIWNDTVDVEWIKDVKVAQGEAKNRRFFGVPVTEYPKDVTVIDFWVNNLLREDTKKDPFTTDYRRILAQDKKARSDGKAGYDVRF